MAKLLILTLASLLAGGQAAVRTESSRRDAGECAAANNQNVFTQGLVTGGLPSAPVVQAETDVVGADLIEIEYGSNYKVVTEKKSKEHYVLTQCGTTPPTDKELAAVSGFDATYKVKHFTIPLQVVSSSSTVHLAFFKALGVEDRVKYVSQYATGACWQKALACGGKLNTSAASGQMAEMEAHFMDCNFDGTCDNVNKEAKGVHFSASQDPGPLRSAEHIKFMAAFFNKEELATQLFAKTLAAYTSASVKASPKPVVAWIAFAPKSKWAPAAFTLSQASYKLKMVADAGGANVDGAAVKTQMGSKMSVTEAASGKTYTAKLSSFNGSKTAATAAFFAALDKVDIIIDETYAFAPKSYTFDSFMTEMGLTKASTLKFMKNKMVLRIDGTISENDGLDWYESRIAHPDWAVEGLAHQIHADASKKYMYFRNIAKGEAPKVVTKSMCTATLPACDSKAYPSPIGMMVGSVTANAAAKSLGFLLLLAIAAVQV